VLKKSKEEVTERLEGSARESAPGNRKKRSGGISRRALLKGTVAGAALQAIVQGAGGTILAAGTGLAGAVEARAQATGLEPGGGEVPFRQPMGMLNYLDRKQYIHNMKIHAHLPGVMVSGGEPLMNLWAKGARRVLTGGNGFVDITNPLKPEVISNNVWEGSLPGVAFQTKTKKWILTAAAQEPTDTPNPQHPNGRFDPERLAQSRNFKGLRGIRTYDITDIEKPRLLQEFSTGATGHGTHMNFYDGGQYGFLDAGWTEDLYMEASSRPWSNALMIVDMSDPANIKEISRWWAPGQMRDELDEYKKWIFAGDHSSWSSAHGAPVVPKRLEDGGRYGFGGFGAFGMYVFDFSDVRKPKAIGRAHWQFEPRGGIPFHTVHPVLADESHPRLRNIIVTTSETLFADFREPYHTPHVVDFSDLRNPRVIAQFPRPEAPKDAPYPDFALARGRFGSHNTQAWIAPGRARPEFMAISFFNAGIRIFDISDPREPQEVAWFVPPHTGEMDNYESWYRGMGETVFVEWDRNLIWLGTHGGTYCLSTPSLGEPVLESRKIERWTMPHFNAGWDG
jgi:hypothetical protein